MIIAVHAVTSRRNTRPRAVTFLGTGEQEDDRIDKGDRQSCAKVSPVPYCVVLKEGNLVSSAAMGRWHTPHPPSQPSRRPKPMIPRVFELLSRPNAVPKWLLAVPSAAACPGFVS